MSVPPRPHHAPIRSDCDRKGAAGHCLPASNPRTMTPFLTQRCSLALLVSLAVALAFGLLAAGPIVIDDAALAHADQRMLLGVPNLINALCCLPLAAVSVWGAMAVHRSISWPSALRRPAAGFFGLSLGWSLLAAGHHLVPSRTGAVAIHVLVAASCVLWILTFLAERHGLRFGSRRVCALAVAVAAVAGLGWWWSDGDARALVWLQALPLLLLATGVFAQRGLFTRQADWAAMLSIYVLARAADLFDVELFNALGGWIGGHALMHLAGAGAAAVLARRAWRGVRDRAHSAPLSMSSRRVTSLHTAG